MATRTLDEIKQAIRADFVANVTLQEVYGLDLAKTFDEQFSAISIEAIFTYIVASAIYLHELIVDDKTTKLEARIAAEYPFSMLWYETQAKNFQLGDYIVFNETTFRFGYAAIDESKRIVKFVSIREREISGVTTLQIFAAKTGKVALSAPELTAFQSYIKQIGAAGTHFQFISLAPDQLQITLNVTYNPQIISGTGETYTDGVKTVNAAVADYLDNIRYSGRFNRTKLVDAVQNAPGVLDVVLGEVKINGDVIDTQSFESPSGFYQASIITVTYTAGNSDDY